MTVQVSTTSRLNLSDLLDVDDVVFWDMVDYPNIPRQQGDIIYTVLQTDRIDALAYRYYGNPSFWWIIAVANDMEILPTDLHISAQIIIPSPSYINDRFIGSLTPVI